MRTPRLYVPVEYKIEIEVSLTKIQTHYVLNVLRLKDKHIIEVFDGNGNQAQAVLEVTSKRSAKAYIKSIKKINRESTLRTTLLQGISKGERMDLSIQKSVELGINKIQPLLTNRSAIKLSPEKSIKRQQHWQLIAESSCEQCGRNIVPKVELPICWQEYYKKYIGQTIFGLILDPKAKHKLSNIPDKIKEETIHLFIGPEGGLTEEEIQQACELKMIPVNLGSRILRTETAGITVLAALQYRWGDLNM